MQLLILKTMLKSNFGIPEEKITTATNGQEALDYVRGATFDLILMDLNMPVMGGMDSAKKI